EGWAAIAAGTACAPESCRCAPLGVLTAALTAGVGLRCGPLCSDEDLSPGLISDSGGRLPDCMLLASAFGAPFTVGAGVLCALASSWPGRASASVAALTPTSGVASSRPALAKSSRSSPPPPSFAAGLEPVLLGRPGKTLKGSLDFGFRMRWLSSTDIAGFTD